MLTKQILKLTVDQTLSPVHELDPVILGPELIQLGLQILHLPPEEP
jgi:hypothetical protein